jgi:hypothetical protein
MKNFALALVALTLAAPAAAQDIAPPVKRKPVAASTAPATPQQSVTASPAPAAPPQAPRTGNERDIHAALSAVAAQSGGDAALDGGLIRVMSRLVAAGRCGDAVSLANRDGRKELASRAQQLCK